MLEDQYLYIGRVMERPVRGIPLRIEDNASKVSYTAQLARAKVPVIEDGMVKLRGKEGLRWFDSDDSVVFTLRWVGGALVIDRFTRLDLYLKKLEELAARRWFDATFSCMGFRLQKRIVLRFYLRPAS